MATMRVIRGTLGISLLGAEKLQSAPAADNSRHAAASIALICLSFEVFVAQQSTYVMIHEQLCFFILF